MKSKITGGETRFLFRVVILNKYEVNYYKCIDTGYIQTEEPYWLAEAYSSTITKLDVGLVHRNISMAKVVEKIIFEQFNADKMFLDYAGGYGLFTRIMRDKGYNFYNTDKYCENIFAEYHDLQQLEPNTKFEIITAFEVFEHLIDPLVEIAEIFKATDNLLFSTEIIPNNITKPEDWWYFIPETGQHISFYTIPSLEKIAAHFNKYFYSDGKSVHLFSSKKINANPFATYEDKNYWVRKMREKLNRYDNRNNINIPARVSLIDKDWNDAKRRLKL